jgi:hypothetical protein
MRERERMKERRRDIYKKKERKRERERERMKERKRKIYKKKERERERMKETKKHGLERITNDMYSRLVGPFVS